MLTTQPVLVISFIVLLATASAYCEVRFAMEETTVETIVMSNNVVSDIHY